MTSELIAYCGLYCGACSFRVAFEENSREHITHMPTYYDHLKNEPLEFCPGCRLENICGECAIRDCAMDKGIEYCSQCNDFPCDKSIKFNSDGKPHHEESISNLNLLKEIGKEKWIDSMRERWTCKCGAKYSWYHKECTKCNINEVKDSIAYCGLICKLCHLASTCNGCKSENNCCGRHLSGNGCYQYSCCVERGINGCWECEDFSCDKDMFSETHDIRLRAFVRLAKEEGVEKLAEYILKNQQTGIIYGHNKDYDGLENEDAVLRILRTGNKR